jgi:hypothetical protein
MDNVNSAGDIYASLRQRLAAGFRRRWWGIPLAVLSFTLFIWAQESDLQTTPGSYGVYKTYELRDPALELAAVGIPATAVSASPGDEVLATSLSSASSSNRGGPKVNITLSNKLVDFVSSAANDSGTQDTFTFNFDRTRQITFGCVEEQRSDCDAAIDAAVDNFFTLRHEAFVDGSTRLATTLDRAITSTAVSTTEKEKLTTQREFVRALASAGPLTPVLYATLVEERGATITTVAGQSYAFGVGVGLLLGLLFVLQTALTDRRIRTERELISLVGRDVVLGQFSSRDQLRIRNLQAAAEVWQAETSPARQPTLCVLHSARQELPDEFLHSVGSQRERVLSLDDASHEALAQLRAKDIILCLTSAQTTQAQVRDAMELLRRVKVAETRVVLYQP